MAKVLLLTPFSLIAGCAYLFASETAIAFAELPLAVQIPAREAIKGGEVVEVERETGLFSNTYGIVFMQKGRRWELEYTDKGTLLAFEIENTD